MIPKSAIRAFLAKPRRDYRGYKTLSFEQLEDLADKLPIEPPIWDPLRKHQRACLIVAANTRRFQLNLDTGCLSGETLLETEHGPVRIDELEKRGAPIKVWSNTTNGVRLVPASCPFKKGPTSLFEVTFASGRTITVTARHRFLTERGWTFCADLFYGERLPAFALSQPGCETGVPSFRAASSFDIVVSVKYKREDVYYDLHVPVHKNYIAHGLCHHNTGKTFLSIAIAEYFKALGSNNRFLVLVPNIVNKYEWAREIRKHHPATSYCILSGSTTGKWQALQETDALIVLETYGGFLRMLTELTDVKVKRHGKTKLVPKLRPQKRLIKAMLEHIDGLIMDESTNVANHRALPYRLCRQIAKNTNAVFGLSGTPFGRDPQMLWAQMHLIDGGETLGPTLGLFREALFKAKENFWGGYDYSFPKKNWPILHRMMANRSLRYVAKESDLPPVVAIRKTISLGVEAKTYYARAKKALIAARGNFREMKNPFLRMRQISSGFVGYHDDEEGVRAEFEFKNNPKLELLMSIIQSIRPDRKIIVFHDFVFSGSIISRELDKLDIGHVRLLRKTKDASELLHRFDHDPKCRVFILSTAGAFGLNLQIAKYGIFYESPVSVIQRKQMQRRIERQGSKHDKVFVYDLIVQGTADESILRFHQEGRDIFKSVIEGVP